jgi:REP element-mobilizing transposase RayT/CheY-like chemotaxis protein
VIHFIKMSNNLLLVTADTLFAKRLTTSLEQEGYRMYSAKGKGEAVVRADEQNCATAFLDFELGEKFVLELGRALRTLNPTIRLLLIADEDTTPPALDELRPWALVRKPVRTPELLTMLRDNPTPLPKPIRATNESPAMRLPEPETHELPWLLDVTKAAQHLTRLTLESSAQAALITRKDNLWAYAGQLSQSAAKELAVTVTRHWDGQKGSDLLRFVRLEATKAEHMLYATRLADEVVLALVFDAETPFSTIRMQAGQLVNMLSTTPTVEAAEPPGKQNQTPASEEATTQYAEEDESNPDLEIPNITDILNDIPSPTPDATAASTREEDWAATTPSNSRPRKYSRESSPAVHVNDLLISNQQNEQTVEHVVEDFDATMPSKSRQRPVTPVRRPGTGELDETRPHSITEVAGRVMMEPISPGLYNLTYACLLVPRFSSHYLTGDISDRISEWLPQICIAFGWRLEYLAVRPEYVQWVVNVPPSTSPGYLMRIMRTQTSEKIFGEFPRMKKENPSGDFWAPGYLIMGGTQPHPPQLVKDYIKQTRTRQGYSQPRK